MTARTTFGLYLVALHLAGVALARPWLQAAPWRWILAELAVAVSAAVGWLLLRRMGLPRELVATGRELLEERDFGSSFRPTGDAEVDALVDLYNALAERLRQERLQLQEQNLFLDEVLTASPAGVVTLDLDRRVSLVNPAAMALLGTDAPVGSAVDAVPGPLGEALAEVAIGSSRLVDLGAGRRVRVSHAHFLDRGFSRSFFLLEELTEELRASERAAYEKLVRMIAHEVNNTVGAVGSLLDELGEAERLDPEEWNEFRAPLRLAAERLRRLDRFIEGFAEVVRLPAPSPRPADLAAVADAVVAVLGAELSRRRIAVRWQRRDELPPLDFDESQIEGALLNVVKNAAEAIGEDGALDLRLVRDGRTARLEILDSGPGLSEAVRRQLFLPFVSTKREGRGLGLTLVREVMTAHGFRFGLENRAEGGACFRVELPLPRSLAAAR